MKKALAFLLTLTMLCTANFTMIMAEELPAENGWSSPLSNTALTVIKSTAQAVSLGTKVNVTITDQNVVDGCGYYAKWYSFTPGETGDFHFTLSDAEQADDPEVAVYDAGGWIKGSQYYGNGQEDIHLQKGETYYIMASVGVNETGQEFQTQSYSFTISRDNFNLIYEPEVECYVNEPITVSIQTQYPVGGGNPVYRWGITRDYVEEVDDGQITWLNETGTQYAFSPEQGDTYLFCAVTWGDKTKYARIHVDASYFKLKYNENVKALYEQPTEISVSGNAIDKEKPISLKWCLGKANVVTGTGYSYTMWDYSNTISENTVSVNGVDGYFSDKCPVIAKGTARYACKISQGDNEEMATFYVTGSSFDAQVINVMYMNFGETKEFGYEPHMKDGSPDNFTYEWEVFRIDQNGKYIVYDASDEVIIGGLNKNPLTIKPDRPCTLYTVCAITSAAGERKSYSGTIYVKAPKISVRPVSDKVFYLKKGESANLQVGVDSKWKDLHYQWYQGDNGSEEGKIAGAETDKYKATLTQDLEAFYCSVNNGLQDAFESDSQKFVLVDTSRAVNLSGNPSVPTALVKDQPKLCHISKTETGYYASFRPDKTGVYACCIEGTHDGYLRVWDQNDNEPDTSSFDIDSYSIDSRYNGNSWYYRLEAGKTYTIKVSLYNDDDSEDPQNVNGYSLLAVTEAVYNDMKNATVTLSQSSFVYDGKEKRPAVTVKLAGHVLVEGRDYTVTYQNNVNAGTATVLIKGREENWFSGSCTKTFTISAPVQPAQQSSTGLQQGEEVKKSGATYTATADGAVAYKTTESKKASSISVPDTIQANGVTYKVTTIGADAFKGATAKKITVGKNITTIKNNAFKGDKKLKTLIIRSTKLTKSGISKKAFKGITKKTTIKVPKKKLKAYKKLFRQKGLAKSVKVKAI